MSNFKVGDTVKLIRNSLHSYLSINDVGTIVLIDSDKTCRVNTDKYTSNNWVMLSDLELVKIENKLNEVIIKVPEGYVIDEDNSSFTCIKFKKEEKKEVKCWEDLERIEGYCVGYDSDIKYIGKHTPEDHSKNTFANKEQAEACIALAMLSQLMKDVNVDWIPDWTEEVKKFVIQFDKDNILKNWYYTYSYFLAFPTAEIRDTFLKNHKKLIIKAKPLL